MALTVEVSFLPAQQAAAIMIDVQSSSNWGSWVKAPLPFHYESSWPNAYNRRQPPLMESFRVMITITTTTTTTNLRNVQDGYHTRECADTTEDETLVLA